MNDNHCSRSQMPITTTQSGNPYARALYESSMQIVRYIAALPFPVTAEVHRTLETLDGVIHAIGPTMACAPEYPVSDVLRVLLTQVSKALATSSCDFMETIDIWCVLLKDLTENTASAQIIQGIQLGIVDIIEENIRHEDNVPVAELRWKIYRLVKIHGEHPKEAFRNFIQKWRKRENTITMTEHDSRDNRKRKHDSITEEIGDKLVLKKRDSDRNNDTYELVL